jgi:arylsulfatase A-like enzyme
MGCYGFEEETTPFLTEFAERALVFDSAVANGIWTVPSHASLFTGLSVRQHGADSNRLWLDGNVPTVAKMLRSKGYATAAFTNNPWISPSTHLAQGFGVCRLVCRLGYLGVFSLESLGERWGVTPRLPWLDGDWGAALTNQLVAEWLDSRVEDGRPFFLFVNYMEAHLPYRVPRRYRRMFMTEQQVHRSYDLRKRVHGDLKTALHVRFNAEGGRFLAEADRDVLRRQYMSAIRYLDDRVAELVGMLEQRGLAENTLIVVTSDHGEHLGTHGMWSHRFQTYNELTRIPLLIRVPGGTGSARVSVPVQLSDLYCTIGNAALARSGPGPGYDSRDLIALSRAEAAPRVAVVEQGGPNRLTHAQIAESLNPELARMAQPRIAAVDGRFKYIVAEDGRRELYDIVADPGELHNLVGSSAGEAERLAAYLDRWRRSVPRHRPSETPRLSQETVDELRALGYLGGT